MKQLYMMPSQKVAWRAPALMFMSPNLALIHLYLPLIKLLPPHTWVHQQMRRKNARESLLRFLFAKHLPAN